MLVRVFSTLILYTFACRVLREEEESAKPPTLASLYGFNDLVEFHANCEASYGFAAGHGPYFHRNMACVIEPRLLHFRG